MVWEECRNSWATDWVCFFHVSFNIWKDGKEKGPLADLGTSIEGGQEEHCRIR